MTEATELSYTLYTLRTISSNIIHHPKGRSELRDAVICTPMCEIGFYRVISVSKDGKEVVLQRYSPRRADDRGVTDAQEYIYGRWYAKYGEKMEYYDFSF